MYALHHSLTSDNAVCLKVWAFLYLNQIQIILFLMVIAFPTNWEIFEHLAFNTVYMCLSLDCLNGTMTLSGQEMKS